jgi:hypothetical protein
MCKRNERAARIQKRLDHLAASAGLRLDANETAIFSRQLEAIDAEMYEVMYPPADQAVRLIPVNSSIPDGATSYTYRVFDQVGQAARIGNYATDLPRVDIQGREITSKIHSYGDSYGYSVQDLRAAAMAKLPLETQRAQAARLALMRKLDEVLFEGDADAGLTGFANNSDVDSVSADTGDWATATGAEMLGDLLKLERAINAESKGQEMADALALPPAEFALISTTPLGDTSDKTVKEFFLANSSSIKTIEPWWRLSTANAAGTGPRAIAYTKTPAKLEAIVPVEFESFPAEARNLEFIINCHMRTGGVVIRYPGSMRYMDLE